MKIIGELLRALGYIKRSDTEHTVSLPDSKETQQEMIVVNGVARPKKKFSDAPPKFVRKR
jgi:hypothetical protein